MLDLCLQWNSCSANRKRSISFELSTRFKVKHSSAHMAHTFQSCRTPRRDQNLWCNPCIHHMCCTDGSETHKSFFFVLIYKPNLLNLTVWCQPVWSVQSDLTVCPFGPRSPPSTELYSPPTHMLGYTLTIIRQPHTKSTQQKKGEGHDKDQSSCVFMRTSPTTPGHACTNMSVYKYVYASSFLLHQSTN